MENEHSRHMKAYTVNKQQVGYTESKKTESNYIKMDRNER